MPLFVCGRSCDNDDDLIKETFEINVEYMEDFTKNNVSGQGKRFVARKNSANVRFAPFNPKNYRAGMVYNGYVSFVSFLIIQLCAKK